MKEAKIKEMEKKGIIIHDGIPQVERPSLKAGRRIAHHCQRRDRQSFLAIWFSITSDGSLIRNEQCVDCWEWHRYPSSVKESTIQEMIKW